MAITKEVTPFLPPPDDPTLDFDDTRLSYKSVKILQEEFNLKEEYLEEDIASFNALLWDITKRFSRHAAEAEKVYIDAFGQPPDWQGTLTKNLQETLSEKLKYIEDSSALKSALERLLAITKEVTPFLPPSDDPTLDFDDTRLSYKSVKILQEEFNLKEEYLEEDIASFNALLWDITKRFSRHAAEAEKVYIDAFGQPPDWQGTLTKNLQETLSENLIQSLCDSF